MADLSFPFATPAAHGSINTTHITKLTLTIFWSIPLPRHRRILSFFLSFSLAPVKLLTFPSQKKKETEENIRKPPIKYEQIQTASSCVSMRLNRSLAVGVALTRKIGIAESAKRSFVDPPRLPSAHTERERKKKKSTPKNNSKKSDTRSQGKEGTSGTVIDIGWSLSSRFTLPDGGSRVSGGSQFRAYADIFIHCILRFDLWVASETWEWSLPQGAAANADAMAYANGIFCRRLCIFVGFFSSCPIRRTKIIAKGAGPSYRIVLVCRRGD